MRKIFRQTLIPAVAALVMVTCGTMAAKAQYREDIGPVGPPVAVPNPEITEKPNAAIPQDLVFTRWDGKKVKLADLFNQNKPVILSLVYFSCPNLCGFTQDDLVNAVKEGPRGLVLGKDYDIVVVSIDPDDTPAAAAAKRNGYLKKLERPESQAGFTYLTGTRENIKALADTVGFGYRQNFGLKPDDTAGKFAHSSGIFICTSYGRLSQTILGVNYEPDTIHNALRLASDGKIATGMLGVGLACGAMRFNPNTGRYESNPWFWAGTAGGGASIAFVGIFMSLMWRGEWKRRKAHVDDLPAHPAV